MEGNQCRGEQCERPESSKAGLQGGVRLEGGMCHGRQGSEQDHGLDKTEQ